MVEPTGGEEPDTSEAVVRALLAAECPQWAGLPLQHVGTSGTDHAMWRCEHDGGRDVVVRLPRHPGAIEGAELEHQLLQRLEATPLASLVSIPQLLHDGGPHERFPHRWSVLSWLDGDDAWTARHEVHDSPRLGARLAEVVSAIRDVGPGLPVPKRGDDAHGLALGPHLELLLDQLDRAGRQAALLLDAGSVRRLAEEAYDLADPTTTCFLHGDLIPGNVLVQDGAVTGLVDWGNACYGDPARDLSPAWSILGHEGRRAFRAELAPDDATWARGRALELCHAVDAVLRHRPRRHALGDVMTATLDRILSDP